VSGLALASARSWWPPMKEMVVDHTKKNQVGVYFMMKSAVTLTLLTLTGAITLAHSVAADDVRIESYPSNRLFKQQILLHVPANRPSALLVLLPAGDIHSYDEQSGYTPSRLPRMLATNDVMTMIASPNGSGSYTADASLEELEGLIAAVRDKFNIPSGKVAIGGFSGGGMGAMRYAQFCAKSERRKNRPVAVFVVDSPLDYEHFFLAAELHLKQLALGGRDLAEDRGIVKMLREELGGSPTEAPGAYRRQSPVSILVADGGNARLLKETPIRIYIEPDINWRIENWNRDIYTTNIPDATALINILRLLGNRDAELITTSGKGYRPDGSRNPHSWSIVDEPGLAKWLIELFGRSAGR
jgi:pimeloyl-ACP methyl ester carboxylesterase